VDHGRIEQEVKMRARLSVFVVLIALIGTVVAAQQGEVEKSKAKPEKNKVGKLELDKIVFGGHGKAQKAESDMAEETQEPEGEVPEEPQALTEEERSAAIDRIKELASQQELQTRAILVYKPVYLPIAITARDPYVSWGYISLHNGSWETSSNRIRTEKGEYDRYAPDLNLKLLGLQPGSHYMLDVTVENNSQEWKLYGKGEGTDPLAWMVNTRVIPSAGHLIVGFVAPSATAYVSLRPYEARRGTFYRANLTRLN